MLSILYISTVSGWEGHLSLSLKRQDGTGSSSLETAVKMRAGICFSLILCDASPSLPLSLQAFLIQNKMLPPPQKKEKERKKRDHVLHIFTCSLKDFKYKNKLSYYEWNSWESRKYFWMFIIQKPILTTTKSGRSKCETSKDKTRGIKFLRLYLCRDNLDFAWNSISWQTESEHPTSLLSS